MALRSTHENKFDRQLRLWGFHGQRNLENARVIVLGSGAVASETLKNLVLPNLAEFIVVDDAVVRAKDLGNNFFVTQEAIGKPRAQEIVQNLLELNPTSVKGSAILKSPKIIVDNEKENFWKKFQLVIATQLMEESLRKLAEVLYPLNIPFIHVVVNGLVGICRIAIREHQIVESHPENDRFDLCLHPIQLKEFPEYADFLDRFNLDAVDEQEHAHIPFVSILAKISKFWMEKHDGRLPVNLKESQEFKNLIISKARNYSQEMNFQEAVQFAYYCYKDPSERIDPHVIAVLNSPLVDTSDDKFWVMLYALKRFISKEGNGLWPVLSSLPDITCLSKDYVSIKQIFEGRFQRDLKIIKQLICERLAEIGKNIDYISDEEVQVFVKNSRNLRVENYRSIASEYLPDEHFKHFLKESLCALEDDEEDDCIGAVSFPSSIHWYIAFRATERFRNVYSRFPGSCEDSKEMIESDTSHLIQHALELTNEWGIDKSLIEKDCLLEMVRFGGSEVHNICAVMGALAAQEALKIVTKQYVPFNNTVIFNGIDCSMERHQL